MSDRKVKVILNNGDIRRAVLPKAASFADAKEMVTRLFRMSTGETFKIRYRDEDDDMVLICTDDDLNEAINFAQSQSKTLKLHVETQDKEVAPKDKDEAAPAEDKPAKQSEAAYPEVKKQANKQKENKGGEDWRKGQRNRHGRYHGGHRWHRQQRRERRDEERTEFEKEIAAFLSDEKVIKAIQASLPMVADKLLKKEDLKKIIEDVLDAQPVLKDHALVKRLLPLFNSLIGFVPGGVVGPILLDIVLDLQSNVKDGKLDMPCGRLFKKILRGIKRSVKRNTPVVHFGVVCDKCDNNQPIVGPRWKKDNENYDLCQNHYEELKEEDKSNYHEMDHPRTWRPPCAFGIPGFHPGPFAFSAFGGGRGWGPPPAFGCPPPGAFGCPPSGPFGHPPHQPSRHDRRPRPRQPRGPSPSNDGWTEE